MSAMGKIARGLGIREQMMKGMMVIMTRGIPILGANMIMCPNCPAGLNVIRAMQLSIMRAMQPSTMRAMQPSSIRAMQPSTIEGNAAQQYQSNAAQLYEGSAAQQYRSTAAQHSQSNAAQFQGNAAQPYWGNIVLPPAFLGNVTQGWMGSVPPAPVGNEASFHMSYQLILSFKRVLICTCNLKCINICAILVCCYGNGNVVVSMASSFLVAMFLSLF